jgi:hypothetical protein
VKRLGPCSSCYRSLAGGALLAVGLAASAQGDSRLLVETGPGSAGPAQWRGARIEYEPGPDGRWRLEVDELSIAEHALSLSIDCARGAFRGGAVRCDSGRFAVTGLEGGPLEGGLSTPASDSAGVRFELDDGSLSGRIAGVVGGGPVSASAMLRFSEFELSRLPGAVVELLGLSVLDGRLSGTLQWADGAAQAEVSIGGGAFDRPDGLAAGGDVDLTLSGGFRPGADGEAGRFEVDLTQTAGELLIGPVYLPPPSVPLELAFAGRIESPARMVVESFRLRDDAVAVDGRAALARSEGGWRLDRVDVEQLGVEFPGAWRRWADGPAAAFGLGGLETRGQLSGSFAWEVEQGLALSLDVAGVGVDDERDRFAIAGLEGRIQHGQERVSVDLDWASLSLFKLLFGASELVASGRPENWSLSQPLRLSLVDGAVVFDTLSVATDTEGGRTLELDLRIEPLDLARLTRMLDFPIFGGQLSGRFPGVRLTGDRIAFTGGIDVAAFSGRIGLTDLVIERPFGTLPALAAQVEFERLDLAELTGAFNFGHMEGELSGWMRDLRLLDWQPVAMDARVYTHEDAPSRRISQRAVENLSRLGGGAAAIGATLLRVFEEFPYRRAGLACRLDRNICHIDGVAPHESGGFYIVEGRGLPHLDVVGHRRLVDWPRLVAQLVAMTEE